MKAGTIILSGIITGLVIGMLYQILTKPAPLPLPTQDPRIEELQRENDSLDVLLTQRQHTDTLYYPKYVQITAKADSQKVAVAALPATEQVEFFAEKTGTDSIEMLPDTTAKVTPATITAANMLFIEGEAAKYKVSVMTEHLAFKDTTIQLQKKRILSTDSLDAIKDFQYKVTANFLTAEAKRQNTNKRIYQGTTVLATLLLAVSLFR